MDLETTDSAASKAADTMSEIVLDQSLLRALQEAEPDVYRNVSIALVLSPFVNVRNSQPSTSEGFFDSDNHRLYIAIGAVALIVLLWGIVTPIVMRRCMFRRVREMQEKEAAAAAAAAGENGRSSNVELAYFSDVPGLDKHVGNDEDFNESKFSHHHHHHHHGYGNGDDSANHSTFGHGGGNGQHQNGTPQKFTDDVRELDFESTL